MNGCRGKTDTSILVNAGCPSFSCNTTRFLTLTHGYFSRFIVLPQQDVFSSLLGIAAHCPLSVSANKPRRCRSKEFASNIV
jgi:hypothetical protein